jgi:hypothetical protein
MKLRSARRDPAGRRNFLRSGSAALILRNSGRSAAARRGARFEPVEPGSTAQLSVLRTTAISQKNKDATVWRRFRAGASCAAKASSARGVLPARGRASSPSPAPSRVKTQGRSSGFFNRLTSRLSPPNRREEKPTTARFGGGLGPGDLFGEMTCMSYCPPLYGARGDRCTMLEMRNVLDVL